jgi:hypothetical protein
MPIMLMKSDAFLIYLYYQSMPLCCTGCQMIEKHNLRLQIQNKITEEQNNFSNSNRKIVKRERVY